MQENRSHAQGLFYYPYRKASTMTDVNNAQPVTEQGVNATPPVADNGVTPQVAAVDGVSQPTTETGTADGQQTQEQMIPKSRFDEINERMKAAEQTSQQALTQLQLLKANASQPQTAEQKSLFKSVAKQLGYNGDFLTTDETANVMDTILTQQQQRQQATVQQQAFLAQHPDFDKVVGKQNPLTGQFDFAPPLMRQIQKNPGLVQTLQTHPEGGMIAYSIAVNDPEYIKETTNQKAQQVATTTKPANQVPKSISSIPGGGTLDKASHMQSMTDAEFKAHLEEVKSRAV